MPAKTGPLLQGGMTRQCYGGFLGAPGVAGVKVAWRMLSSDASGSGGLALRCLVRLWALLSSRSLPTAIWHTHHTRSDSHAPRRACATTRHCATDPRSTARPTAPSRRRFASGPPSTVYGDAPHRGSRFPASPPLRLVPLPLRSRKHTTDLMSRLQWKQSLEIAHPAPPKQRTALGGWRPQLRAVAVST